MGLRVKSFEHLVAFLLAGHFLILDNIDITRILFLVISYELVDYSFLCFLFSLFINMYRMYYYVLRFYNCDRPRSLRLAWSSSGGQSQLTLTDMPLVKASILASIGITIAILGGNNGMAHDGRSCSCFVADTLIDPQQFPPHVVRAFKATGIIRIGGRIGFSIVLDGGVFKVVAGPHSTLRMSTL